MSNANNELNASASYFGIGATIQMRVDVSALSVNDQLGILHHLMYTTGTTDAICKSPNSEATLKAIEEAWNKFAGRVLR